jgi:curli biogenesis system outer membrane secretion channel CsgG
MFKKLLITFLLFINLDLSAQFIKVVVNTFEDRTGKLEKKEGELEANQSATVIGGATGTSSSILAGATGSSQQKVTGSIIESEKGDLKSQAADIISAELVKIKKFRILDRQSFLRKLNESSHQDPLKAASEIGAHYLISGSITQAGLSESGGQVLGFGGKSVKGNVALNINMVNVYTGEVVLAGVFEGEETKTGISLLGQSVNAKADLGLLISAALKNAIKNSVPKIDSAAGDIFEFPIECDVAYSEGVVYLSKGKDDGIRIGDEFEVVGKGKQLKIGNKTIEEKVIKGLIKINSIEDEYSTAIKLSDFEIKDGDRARRIKNK